jgi:uncharacterized membrane-anchored protein
MLAAVSSIWYARGRALSIHSIVTTSRESWYWLTVGAHQQRTPVRDEVRGRA